MKNIFVKVSGDLFENDQFLCFIAEKSKSAFLVICVGGGSQINDAFKKSDITLKQHGPLGRELLNLDEKQLAKSVLEKNQSQLQDLLVKKNISATVTIPMIDIGSVSCHINGDEMIRAAYLGFDELYVVTLTDRVEKKKTQFSNLDKVSVIGID